jgi:hypothetical protein
MKLLNRIWYAVEDAYGYPNQATRDREFIVQRQTFFHVARKMYPAISLKRLGAFVALKINRPVLFDHASVLHALNGAKMNFKRTDAVSKDFVEKTDIVFEQVKNNNKLTYRKGVDKVRVSYKKLRMLESKLNQTTDKKLRAELMNEISYIERNKLTNSENSIHQPKVSARRELQTSRS